MTWFETVSVGKYVNGSDPEQLTFKTETVITWKDQNISQALVDMYAIINKNNPHACKNNKIQTCKAVGGVGWGAARVLTLSGARLYMKLNV